MQINILITKSLKKLKYRFKIKVKMKKFAFKKIIRDKLYQDLLNDKKIVVDKKELTKEDFLIQLKEKLIEEALEVKEANKIEELKEEIADVIEVINSILKITKIEYNEVEKYRKQKFKERGGFEKPFYINSISMEEDHPDINYLLENKEKYPEI